MADFGQTGARSSFVISRPTAALAVRIFGGSRIRMSQEL